MGQTIEVQAAEFGEILILTTDRSITGQDGVSFRSAADAAEDPKIPGMLASGLWAQDEALAGVFIASNQVVVERSGGWDAESIAGATGVVSEFFLFYPAE